MTHLSQHDPLTGLANRRLFNSFLHNEWRRSMRERTPISFIMLDLDNFKACNDHFGHQVGDDLLRQVGHLLNAFASGLRICQAGSGAMNLRWSSAIPARRQP